MSERGPEDGEEAREPELPAVGAPEPEPLASPGIPLGEAIEELPAAEAEPVEELPPPGERRRVAARGMVINSGFFVALGTLQLLKAVIVARFLDQSEFGVWSILFLTFGLVFALKNVAIGNKYIQQDEPDQELAFQKAFTLEIGSSLLAAALMVALSPLLVLAYGEEVLFAPALVLALTLPGLALQAPIWIFYRRMQFLRQRTLSAVDPIVGFVVTIVLAIAGLDYWSLVIGLVAGAWSGGLVALIANPYRFAWRFDRATMREYISFSWPLLAAVGAGLMIAQLSVFFGDIAIGLAGVGAIGLAATFAAYADRIDSVITQTIYPAICRVVDRGDLLLEIFLKSNRLALMWAVPLGVGLSLFSGDLIQFVIGERWRDTEVLLVTFGLTAAIGHIGFNWVAFYRALGRTRPEAIVTGSVLVAFCVVAIPAMFAWGLEGFAAGIAAMSVVTVIGRWYYLLKLFPRINLPLYMARALAPSAVAVAFVFAARNIETGERVLGVAIAELAAYLLITALATYVFERKLIHEALSYLRGRRSDEAAAA